VSEAQAAVVGQHGAYWLDLLERPCVIVFGPVSDPAGTWGLGVVEAETEDDARALGLEDPAVTSGGATYEVYPMPAGDVRQ
jgi:uncharacterized protein YciI